MVKIYMRVEIRYNTLNVEFSKEEFENMALVMQKTLTQNNNNVPIELCLEMVSQQFGLTYQQILNEFEENEFNAHKYILKEQWIKDFINLNFLGWKMDISQFEDEEKGEYIGDIFDYQIFGESKGVQFDESAVHEIIWKNLLSIIYLEVSINPINGMSFKNKKDLEKYLLKDSNIHDPIIINLLEKVHNNMAALPKDIRIQLLDNITYDYMPETIDSKILYTNKNQTYN